MPTINVLDGAGTSRTVNTLPPTGSAASADSLPVVIASDQSAVPVNPDVTRGSGPVDAKTQRVTLATDGPMVTAIGQPADAAASSDTGSFSLLSLFKRLLQVSTSISSKIPTLYNGRLPANISSVTTTFREPFQTYPGTNWVTVNQVTGDIIQVEGNSGGSSYLVISKNPLDVSGVDTVVETVASFDMPIETSIGLHLSQRTVGQEFSIDITSVEAQSPAPAELTISSIQQAASVLTVNTATAHGLTVGQRIGIYGCVDSRFNYPSLVVATTPTPTQFTVTAGPAGTIPAVTAGPFTSGFVYLRSAMDRRPNGTSIVFENATATNASFYVKSENGDPMQFGGGTFAGNHSVTIGSTASVQPVASPTNYNLRPTTEYRLALMTDRLQWHDVAVDAVAGTTARATVTQVIPNNNVDYKLRFRARNNKGLSAPVAQIVSATKTGTTTATVVTDVPHGLTTGDIINAYTRDTTNFAAIVGSSTAVASVVNATTFTVVWGAAVTATSFGGFVARVNGGQAFQGALAAGAIIQSIVRTANIVTVTGNAAISGVLIGDYVNIIGVRNAVDGSSLGIDGAYRVRNISGTTIDLEPIGTTPTGADIVLTNCGGVIVRRTDMRISFVRMFDFERVRIEALNRPVNDVAGAVPITVQNAPAVAQSGTWNINAITTLPALAAGTNVIGAVNLGIPGTVADVASAALTTTTTTAAFTPTFGTEYQVNIPVTAVTGTTPTLDVVIQESDDSGTNWFDVYHFPRITGTGMFRSPKIALKGNRIRYVQTVGGTTPSFTRAVNRSQGSAASARPQRRIFDRAVSLTTLNATTASLNIQECTSVQLAINLGAATTPPAIQLEGSDDNGVTWYAIGSPLTGVASSTVQLTVPNINAELVRGRVSTVGATVTAGYVEIKAY